MSTWAFIEIASSTDNGDGTSTYSFKYGNSNLLKFVSSTLQNSENAEAYGASLESLLNEAETKICIDTVKAVEEAIASISSQISTNAAEMNTLLTKILALKTLNFELLNSLSDNIRKLNNELGKF